jgi:hypothetical protein
VTGGGALTEATNRRIRPEILLVLAAVGGSFLVYLPFLSDMMVVYRFWDGPNYLTIARNGYDIRPDNPLLAYVYQPSYFLVHLPLYPFCVRMLSFLGYQPALLVVSLAATVAATLLFYRLSRDVWKLTSPGFLTLVFLFLPPRWLLYRSTGATESLYLALALASIFFFEKSNTGRASVAAGLATLTRISGLMLAPAFAVVLLTRKRWRSLPWLVFIPLGLGLYFLYSASLFGNFFEYFSQHGDKMAVFRPFGFLPVLFQQGLYHQAEFHILLALVYAIGISRLRPFPVLFWYCVFEFLLHIFVSTEDWSRYFLAMAPFALVVGFRDLLDTRAFRWLFPGFALLSLVYAWGVIPLNGCRPDIYLRLLAHLGLLGEIAP